MFTTLLALALALSSDALAQGACGAADCPVVADVSSAVEGAGRARTGKISKIWDPLTDVEPGDFAKQGLNPEVMKLALTAWSTAWKRGETDVKKLTVIDYSVHSKNKRLWIIDLETGELLRREYVAHGRHSGLDSASKFSNTNESNKSSVGLLKTAETYYGKYGYSMRFDGLEDGFNSNVRRRAIVMHKSNYVRESYIRSAGRAGRSFGCTALDPAVYKDVIQEIKGGSLVFAYGRDPDWLRNSEYLGEAGRAHAEDLGFGARPTLRRGASGPDVEHLQEKLKAAGFYSGSVDGDFGRGTLSAVKRFQADRGIDANGVVGPETWATLGG